MDLEGEPAVQALILLKRKCGAQSYTLTTQVINTVGQVHAEQTGAMFGILRMSRSNSDRNATGFLCALPQFFFSDEQYLKAASDL